MEYQTAMNRAVITLFVFGLLFAGLEGVADAAGTVESHDAHELHLPAAHAVDVHDHDHDGEEAHSHFCHCTVHGAALFLEPAILDYCKTDPGIRRYQMLASSPGDPPLLRPPII